MNINRPENSMGELPINIIKINLISNVFNKYKKMIAVATIFTTIIGVIYSLSLSNIYRAQATLMIAEEKSNSLSNISGQLGGLASLAGVSLGSKDGNRSVEVLTLLKSRVFTINFIKKNNLSVQLLAAKEFDGKYLIIDNSIYDMQTKTWNSDYIKPGIHEPTDWDLYEAFQKIIKVNQDRANGLITLTIDHVSPKIAKLWIDLLISEINDYIREKDISEAKSSISFLEKEINNTSVSAMQSMFYQLVEKHYQTIMLANVRKEYLLKVLDGAIEPQDKFAPKRTIIVLFFSIFGLLLSSFIAFIIVAKNNGSSNV